MTTDTPFNTDYYQPKKPEPKVQKSVYPDKKASHINVWWRYLNMIVRKQKTA